MHIIPFVKYHGAGNDFIMIDDRNGEWEKLIHEEWIARACHRRFGIGADGMILLQKGKDGADFFMRYYNSDGKTSTFCGNGGRCIVAFALGLGVHQGSCKFLGSDGWHEGEVLDNGDVRISMTDVQNVEHLDDTTATLYTGSPHYVKLSANIDQLDVVKHGRAIRNSPPYLPDGINVNFIEWMNDGELRIRTYERGVEDETYACGTGVVAAAIAATEIQKSSVDNWLIHAKGGDLKVAFSRSDEGAFQNVKLTGPAVAVFQWRTSTLIVLVF